MLAFPALASANVYRVNEPACTGSNETGVTAAASGTDLAKALASAAAHSGSTVVLGPGTYERSKGFEYTSAATVSIRGSGPSSTILTTPLEADATVFALNSAGATLSQVGLQIPAGEGQRGLELRAGLAEHVSIAGGGGKDLPTGLSITGGVFSFGSVQMSEAETTDGVTASGGEILGSSIEGSYGVDASIAATLRGCRILSNLSPIDAYYTKPLTVEDTLIYLRGPAPAAISAVGNANGNATATLRGLTIIDADGTQAGIEVGANKGASSTVTLEDSVIDNFAHPILQSTEDAGSKVATTTDYSSYQAGDDEQVTAGGGTLAAPPSDENPVAATPGFIHPVFASGGLTEGDRGLMADSPLIGAGQPSSLAPGEYAFDAAGNARIVGGRRDVGAYEYQDGAPALSASVSASSAQVGQAITFTGTVSALEPGDAITGYQWSFDDGASVPAGASASHVFATAGQHTATLTATDLLGVTASALVHVSVEPVTACAVALVPRGVDPCSGIVCPAILVPGGVGPCNDTPPTLSRLAMSPSSFRAAKRGASLAHVATGTAVRYSVNSAGAVSFRVERVLAGVAHGSTCRARRRGSKGKRCLRRVLLAGSFAHLSPVGESALRFSGRLDGRALAPGSYLLLASYYRRSYTLAFRILG